MSGALYQLFVICIQHLLGKGNDFLTSQLVVTVLVAYKPKLFEYDLLLSLVQVHGLVVLENHITGLSLGQRSLLLVSILL